MVIFAWRGLPQYGARCIGAFVATTDEKVVVFGNKPRVPVKGMEEATRCPITWIERDEMLSEEAVNAIGIDSDTKLVVGGWGIPGFNQLRDAVIAAGGRVYVMNDANFISRRVCSFFSLRDWKVLLLQALRAIQYRLKYRKYYKGYFVPGKSGRTLARYYGVPDNRIIEGMYAADPTLFYSDKDLSVRDRKIICVGRLCETKNVLNVCEAFGKSGIANYGWSLEYYGTGPFRKELDILANKINQCIGRKAVLVNDFVQPEKLGSLYREAKVFILASKKEHWGVVVHEAALSGCYLLLSTIIGASEDFLGEKNGSYFSPWSVRSIAKAFKKLVTLTESDWDCAYLISQKNAKTHSPSIFAERVQELLKIVD